MSVVFNADGQRLLGTFATPPWGPSQAVFAQMIWAKMTAAEWADIFGISISAGAEYYTNSIIRAAGGVTLDASLVLQAVDYRMDGSGTIPAGWALLGLSYEHDVARICYINGAGTRSVTTSNPNVFAGDTGWVQVFIGMAPGPYGGHNGKFKAAHSAVWGGAAPSPAEWAALYNGGVGGAGKHPRTIQPAHLSFYSSLESDATVQVGSVAWVATGNPTFDPADNPNVEAYSTGGNSLSGAASGADIASGTAAGTVSGGAVGTFTSEPLKDHAGNIEANVTLNYVCLYNDATGALVVRKTGLATNSAGVFTVTDPAIVSGQFYRPDWETSTGHRRMPMKAAT